MFFGPWRRPAAALWVGLAALVALAGCKRDDSKAGSEAAADASARYVSLGAPTTEVLFALGVGARVVGVDVTSRYPAAATELPQLGFYARIPAEGVLALEPTHVFAGKGSGPAAALEQLRSAGVSVEALDFPDTLEGARARITRLGELTGTSERAAELLATLDADVEAAATRPDDADTRVLFLYLRGRKTLLVGGTETGAHELIVRAGFTNAGDGASGYQALTAEAVVAAKPDVLLVPTGGLRSVGGLEGLLALPGVAQTPAGIARRVVALDDAELLSFGPRIGRGLQKLQSAVRDANSGKAPAGADLR